MYCGREDIVVRVIGWHTPLTHGKLFWSFWWLFSCKWAKLDRLWGWEMLLNLSALCVWRFAVRLHHVCFWYSIELHQKVVFLWGRSNHGGHQLGSYYASVVASCMKSGWDYLVLAVPQISVWVLCWIRLRLPPPLAVTRMLLLCISIIVLVEHFGVDRGILKWGWRSRYIHIFLF